MYSDYMILWFASKKEGSPVKSPTFSKALWIHAYESFHPEQNIPKLKLQGTSHDHNPISLQFQKV